MNTNIAQEGFGNHPERINRNGRPKKIYTILKESGYSKDDMREAYHQIAWSEVAELQRLFKDENSPAIIKVIAHAFKRAIEKGDYRYVQEIIEQVIGRAKETIEADINIDYKITLNLNDNLPNNPSA